MRAIDLYAGIGGWSLGLKLAGVEVVQSFEWWQPAVDTHNGNFGGNLTTADVRELALEALPTDIELVVGSPPCTEFSYANRGGRGNISEGIKDLVRFFEVVEYIQPLFWAMENVPRVADVIRTGMQDEDHPLFRFRHLGAQIGVFDFSDFGTPQARKRCIVTNINLEKIAALASKLPVRTLGDVLEALHRQEAVVDPVWGFSIARSQLTEMEEEAELNDEELRLNRDAKVHHPVYNNMSFPDLSDRPARTVTATCTRVSRESIVIERSEKPGSYRRLTIRERACLQGFPITYQFYADSFAKKAKMIGNAIPPSFTYVLAKAALGVPPEEFEGLGVNGEALPIPAAAAPVTLPDRPGRSYPFSRSFRSALPGFRFKSGMRFDLSNRVVGDRASWAVQFYFGASKDVKQIDLDGTVTSELAGHVVDSELMVSVRRQFMALQRLLEESSPSKLQRVWAHKEAGIGPFELTDRLGDLCEEVHSSLLETGLSEVDAANYVVAVASDDPLRTRFVGQTKLEKFALRVIAGCLVGDWFNNLPWHSSAPSGSDANHDEGDSRDTPSFPDEVEELAFVIRGA